MLRMILIFSVAAALPAAASEEQPLAQRLDALGKLVEARGPPDRVAAQARVVRDQIVQRFQVVLRPLQPPDLAHGAQVYAQSCAACHGADGHPNLALGLETRPPDFA